MTLHEFTENSRHRELLGVGFQERNTDHLPGLTVPAENNKTYLLVVVNFDNLITTSISPEKSPKQTIEVTNAAKNRPSRYMQILNRSEKDF